MRLGGAAMTQSTVTSDHFDLLATARRLAALAAIAMTLCSCAAVTGRPTPVFDTDTVVTENSKYLTDPVTKFDSADDKDRGGLNKRQWRDAVIDAYVSVADARYADFKVALNRETVGINLGTDITALGLTAAGAIAKNAASSLSAVATGVIGTGAAFNKDAYYQKTLPALYAAMDTARKQVLIQIRNSQQKGDETTYPLGPALADLKNYEDAGSIEAAIAELTQVATQANANADQQLHPLFVAVVVDDATETRKEKINAYVRQLATKGSKTTLDAVAKALNVSTDPSINVERNTIIIEMDKRVTDKASMDSLSALLKPITTTDF